MEEGFFINKGLPSVLAATSLEVDGKGIKTEDDLKGTMLKRALIKPEESLREVNEQLKPCQCGCLEIELIEANTRPIAYHVFCYSCGTQGPTLMTRELSIKLWNDRPIEDGHTDQLAELKNEVDDITRHFLKNSNTTNRSEVNPQT